MVFRLSLPLLVLLAAGCSSGTLNVGQSNADASSPPPSPDASAPGADSGRTPPPPSDASVPDSAESAEAAAADSAAGDSAAPTADAAPEHFFTLTYSFEGFVQDANDHDHWALHDLTANAWLFCGGSGLDGQGDDTTIPPDASLLAGHTYALEYWFDSNTQTNCGFGNPIITPGPYYVHMFGPVTGNTTLTLMPGDPSMTAP
jgi:hypothetical protein